MLDDHGKGIGNCYSHNKNQEEAQSKATIEKQANMEEEGDPTGDTSKENSYSSPRRRTHYKDLKE